MPIRKNDRVQFSKHKLGVVFAAYREFPSNEKPLNNKEKPDIVHEFFKISLRKITKVQIIKHSGGRYTAYIWTRENA